MAAGHAAALAAMNRASALIPGVVAFLNELPPDTTAAEAATILDTNVAAAEAALRAHVPGVTPEPTG